MTSVLHKRFPKGSVLFNQGDVGDCAYLIDQGRIAIAVERQGKLVPVNILSSGELFGEMALLDGAPRAATATALDDTLVTVITLEQIQERMNNADPVLRLMMGMLLDRLRGILRGKPGSMRTVSTLDTKAQQAAIDRIKIETELRQAVDKRQFVVFYQPIVSLPDGLVVGFEGLVRWQHPEKGLIAPDHFIDITEQSGLIVELGAWVTERACEDLLRLQTWHQKPIFVSINISARQIADSDLAQKMADIARRVGVQPSKIKLEITESLLANNQGTLCWIEDSRTQGFSVALDDFGTGYSSLSYLHKLPIETLKIDRSFVTSMLKTPRSMAIMRALLRITQDLQIQAIAEGIDDASELKTLCELGCGFGQGYLIARPLPIADAVNLLKTSKGRIALPL